MKVPFSILLSQVDKLYEKSFDKNDLEGINKHCDFIREFVNASGWDEVEFIKEMIGVNNESLN